MKTKGNAITRQAIERRAQAGRALISIPSAAVDAPYPGRATESMSAKQFGRRKRDEPPRHSDRPLSCRTVAALPAGTASVSSPALPLGVSRHL